MCSPGWSQARRSGPAGRDGASPLKTFGFPESREGGRRSRLSQHLSCPRRYHSPSGPRSRATVRAFRAPEKGSELPATPALGVCFVPSLELRARAAGPPRRPCLAQPAAVRDVGPGRNEALAIAAHRPRAGHARGPLRASGSPSAKWGTLSSLRCWGNDSVIHQEAMVAVRLLCCHRHGYANTSQRKTSPLPPAPRPPSPPQPEPQPQDRIGRVERGRWGRPGPSARGRPRPTWLWPRNGPSTPADPQGPGQTVT